MKYFLFSYFVCAGLAFTSAWFFYEKPSPVSPGPLVIRKVSPRSAALNWTGGRERQLGRIRRLEQQNETPPRLCGFKEKCSQSSYRNAFAYKNLFEAAPPFMRGYDYLYSDKLKGGQTLHFRRGYFARNGVYMSPDLMIVRPPVPSGVYGQPSRNTARQTFREILFTNASKARKSLPENQKTDASVMFQSSLEESKLPKEETLSSTEIMRAFTEVSPQERNISSTSGSSFLELRPTSFRPYAVKEIVDEGQPIEGDRTGNKPFFVPNLKTEIRSRTSGNSRIVKVTQLSEKNETVEKTSQKGGSNNHPMTTDHFSQISPSHRSRGLNNPEQRPINHQNLNQTKDLKATTKWMQNHEVMADNRSEKRSNSSASRIENRESIRTTETTPSDIRGSPKQNKTVDTSLSNEIKSVADNKKQVFSPKSESHRVTPSETNSTPSEVTFLVREIVNVTDVPEFTLTWKIRDGAKATAREILNTVGYITRKNSTTAEEFTDRPVNFLTERAEGKKEQETFWKNSRKMHFNQDPRPNTVSDAVDQRRSDILINDNFDDYLDEEYSLSYLEKLKRKNNSSDTFRNLTSNSLIPLIPQIIQDLRQGKIPPEDVFLLSEAFGDKWATILELTNSTNMDMLPLLKMRDETDLKKVLQSVLPHAETTTAQTAFTDVEYDSYDYLEKFKDLYEDLLTVGQELREDEEKKFEKRVKGWKRSRKASET